MCDCDGCCSYPHGNLSLWVTVLSIAAYILAINASYPCYFATVDIDLFDEGDTFCQPFCNLTLNGFGIGIFSYEDPQEFLLGSTGTSYCVAWNSDSAFFDAPFRTARAFAVIGNICIGLGMLVSIFMACFRFTACVRTLSAILLIFGSVSYCLVFTFFASETACRSLGKCEFSTGAGLAIGAIVMALISGVVMAKIPEARDDFMPGQPVMATASPAVPAGTVTIQETIEADGTKKIVKTTTNADGSKTVEETIERPVKS